MKWISNIKISMARNKLKSFQWDIANLFCKLTKFIWYSTSEFLRDFIHRYLRSYIALVILWTCASLLSYVFHNSDILILTTSYLKKKNLDFLLCIMQNSAILATIVRHIIVTWYVVSRDIIKMTSIKLLISKRKAR